jgi:1-acyl-sn-glycerol-3-phosphate acyltransferase
MAIKTDRNRNLVFPSWFNLDMMPSFAASEHLVSTARGPSWDLEAWAPEFLRGKELRPAANCSCQQSSRLAIKGTMMKSRLRRLLLSIVRILLKLRYRIEMEGIEQLGDVEGPTLFLPNHPAYIDPAIVLAHMPPRIEPRPLVFTETYRIGALYPLMRIVDAVEVPDLRRGRRSGVKTTRALIESVTHDLDRGDSFLIYPSGRLQRENQEQIGTARAVHDFLKRCSDVNVVLIRIRGVWGSVFSCAPTGDVPKLRKIVLIGIPRLLGSLILFLPRRQVNLTLERMDAAELASLSRPELNRHLERWYNDDGGEPPRYVPYHLLIGPRRRRFANDPLLDTTQVADNTLTRLPGRWLRKVRERRKERRRRSADEASRR